MKYTELTKKYQEKLSDMFDELDVFFAFSDKQLEEGMSKIGIKNPSELVSTGAGGVMPKKNKDLYIKRNKELYTWYVSESKKVNKEEAIRYELSNYECYYTGDTEDAYNALCDLGITKEEVWEVYRKTFQDHC